MLSLARNQSGCHKTNKKLKRSLVNCPLSTAVKKYRRKQISLRFYLKKFQPPILLFIPIHSTSPINPSSPLSLLSLKKPIKFEDRTAGGGKKPTKQILLVCRKVTQKRDLQFSTICTLQIHTTTKVRKLHTKIGVLSC